MITVPKSNFFMTRSLDPARTPRHVSATPDQNGRPPHRRLLFRAATG
jgi:hypothetical protein